MWKRECVELPQQNRFCETCNRVYSALVAVGRRGAVAGRLMKNVLPLALLLLFQSLLDSQTIAVSRVSRPERVTKSWTMVWSDEFNGPDGSSPDPSKWTYDLGAGGWGNGELETYTNSTTNVLQKGGNLVITAVKSGSSYTSARIKTQGLFDHGYGRIEARIKIPYGQGIWPAFWMLGNDIATRQWPACGEIDIMENIGKEPSTVHGTIHGPGYSGENGIGSPFSLASGKFSDDFHIYAIEWEPNQIRFYVDSNLYATRTPADLPQGTNWVYAHNFFIILNLAVGGYWPGNADATTVFPQTMLVDYVRVYEMK
jgi:beta-glucanase (GH16 family)